MNEQQRTLPTVSVVFLTYNHEQFVVEAVRGLLAQTYSPLEIVITDDASSDATADLIMEELANHPGRSDIHFIRNERNSGDQGRSNFLRGLSISRGEFIVMSCGDDVMCPTMIEEMVKTWRSEKVSLVTVNATYIDASSREIGRFRCGPGAGYDESFETLARNGSNITCFGAGMGFERELYDEFGWPPYYLAACDIMVPFYAYLCKGARFIPRPLLKYRVHSKNTSLSLQEESSDEIGKLLVSEEISFRHLAHAFFMESELDRLSEKNPPRFGEIARTIKPLVMTQQTEMARKLVNARIALSKYGIARLRR